MIEGPNDKGRWEVQAAQSKGSRRVGAEAGDELLGKGFHRLVILLVFLRAGAVTLQFGCRWTTSVRPKRRGAKLMKTFVLNDWNVMEPLGVFSVLLLGKTKGQIG